MIYLEKRKEPEFWIDFRKKNPAIHYNDLQKTEEGRIIRNKLREYNIEQQHGLCAYCCRQIEVDTSLNEHIKPRGKGAYAKLSMEYANIVASCNTGGNNATCSAFKENRYDDKFVSPLEEDCEQYFEFYPNGEIVSDTAQGQYTIDVLNLNSYKLRRARKAQLKSCDSYKDSDLVRSIYLQPDADNRLQPFVDIIKYFYGN